MVLVCLFVSTEGSNFPYFSCTPYLNPVSTQLHSSFVTKFVRYIVKLQVILTIDGYKDRHGSSRIVRQTGDST